VGRHADDSLDRLPKLVSERWEADREAHEAALRDGLVVPAETAAVVVSLDGVLAPIDGGNRPADVRNAAAAEGRQSQGPAGYREVGCATVSFCDAKGALLGAIAAAYGDGTRETRHRFEELRDTLRDEIGGVARVIRALDYLRKRFPRRAAIRQCAAYFRRHRKRMDYAGLLQRGARQRHPVPAALAGEAKALKAGRMRTTPTLQITDIADTWRHAAHGP